MLPTFLLAGLRSHLFYIFVRWCYPPIVNKTFHMFKQWGDRQRLKLLSTAVKTPSAAPSGRQALIIFNAEEAQDREIIKKFASKLETKHNLSPVFLGILRRRIETEHIHGHDQITFNNLNRYGYIRMEQYAHFTNKTFWSVMNFDIYDGLNIHHFVHSLKAHQKLTCSPTVSHLYDLVIRLSKQSGVGAYANETLALFSKIMP